MGTEAHLHLLSSCVTGCQCLLPLHPARVAEGSDARVLELLSLWFVLSHHLWSFCGSALHCTAVVTQQATRSLHTCHPKFQPPSLFQDCASQRRKWVLRQKNCSSAERIWQQHRQALWHVLFSLVDTMLYFVLLSTNTFITVLVEGSHAITDGPVSMGVLEDSQGAPGLCLSTMRGRLVFGLITTHQVVKSQGRERGRAMVVQVSPLHSSLTSYFP